MNYNGERWLKKFLPIFIEFSSDISDVVVIDNGSTDQSVNLLKTDFKNVKIVGLENNLGFAGGYNEGLKELKYEYFIIVNSDIEVTKNWIPPLIETLKNNPNVAAVQPKILNYNKKDEFEYAGAAGGFIDILGYPLCRGRIFDSLEIDNNQYNKISEIFWSSGACMVIKSIEFQKYGGFDSDFFAHMEEIDLCWRLKNNGKNIMYCPESTVFHVGGGTLNYDSPKKTYLNYRNNLCMIHKNFKGNTPIFIIILLRIILDQISGLRFLFKGEFKNLFSIYKAHLYYFTNLLHIQNKRKKIKKLPMKKMKGVLNHIIIWKYFINQKRIFTEITKS